MADTSRRSPVYCTLALANHRLHSVVDTADDMAKVDRQNGINNGTKIIVDRVSGANINYTSHCERRIAIIAVSVHVRLYR